MEKPPTNKYRRSFLSQAFLLSSTLVTANLGVYAVGNALKSFDGSLTAGAKTCSPASRPVVPHACFTCGSQNPGTMACGQYQCDTMTGNWVPDSDLTCLCGTESCG